MCISERGLKLKWTFCNVYDYEWYTAEVPLFSPSADARFPARTYRTCARDSTAVARTSAPVGIRQTNCTRQRQRNILLLLIIIMLLMIKRFLTIDNKKDGYRQQNVRQRQKLISIIDYDICILEYLQPFWRFSTSKNGLPLKSGYGVLQGHWKRRGSIDHVWLSISPPL